MGLFSFIKDAGEKLFGGKKVEEAAAANDATSLSQLNAEAGAAIKQYIETQNLGLSNLAVMFDGASGKVTLTGDAPNKEAAEKARLSRHLGLVSMRERTELLQGSFRLETSPGSGTKITLILPANVDGGKK